MLLNNLVKNQFFPVTEYDGKRSFLFQSYDTEERYRKNLKTQPKNWYYRTHPVRYTVNSQGYRTQEFDKINWSESIVMFGCSHVFGVGVTDEHTIPYFLEQISGRPVINMGIGGSSIQTTLFNGTILFNSNYPMPKAIIPFWTYLNRFYLGLKNEVLFYGDWNIKEIQTNYNKYHFITQNLLNIKLFRSLWKDKVIYDEYIITDGSIGESKLIDQLDDSISVKKFSGVLGSARDLSHSGFKDNLMMAKIIYDRIRYSL